MNRKSFVRYGIAMIAVAAALAARFLFSDAMGTTAPFVTFIVAVAYSAWACGTGPTIAAALVSVPLSLYFLIPPHRAFFPISATELIRIGLFLLLSLLIAIVQDVLRRARFSSDERLRALTLETAYRRTILSSIGDAVIATDHAGAVTFVNSVAEVLTGWTQAEAIGKHSSQVFIVLDEISKEPTKSPVDRVLQTWLPVAVGNPAILVKRTGEQIPIEDSAAPIRDESGAFLGAVLVFRDVSERRRSDEALKRSERRLTMALAASGVGVWDWEIATNRLDWTDQVYDIHGVEKGVPIAGVEGFSRLIHPDDRNRVSDAIQTALRGTQPYDVEFRVVHPDGKLVWVATTAQVVRNEAGEPVRMLGATTDITARKEAEEKVLQQWKTFDAALSNISDFAYVFDLNGRFTYVNRALLALWQKPLEDAVGRNFFELQYPDELAQKLQDQIQQVIDTKETLRDETPYTGANGERRLYEYIFVPIVNPAGQVEAVAGSTRDMTERMRSEEALRASNDELRRVNQDLEEVAFVASHDLQEPLRMVNIYTQLILRTLGLKTGELYEYAGFVKQGVNRMESLIHDLLTFAQTVHAEKQPAGEADLSSSLSEALSALKGGIEEAHSEIVAEPLPITRGDTGQLSHVFQNLLSNALKYRKPGECSRIRIFAEPSDGHWTVAVEDNGIGFEPQHAERIFGLFKRLHKQEYPGTGMGLAICKRIVERYGGRIWADSAPGQGATFRFSLPRVEE